MHVGWGGQLERGESRPRKSDSETIRSYSKYFISTDFGIFTYEMIKIKPTCFHVSKNAVGFTPLLVSLIVLIKEPKMFSISHSVL